MRERFIIQLIMAFAGSAGFALMFNVRGRRVLLAAASGTVSWGIYLICFNHFNFNNFFSYLIAAAGLALFSERMARINKAPSTVFYVIGMIPLLPGGSLYWTLHHAVNQNWPAASAYGLTTLMVAMAIALGTIVMMSVIRMVWVSIRTIQAHMPKPENKQENEKRGQT